MFQQPRSLHSMEQIDFLVHQKMLSAATHHQTQPPPLNLECGNQSAQAAKRSRVDLIPGTSVATGYDHPPAINFYPATDPSSSVILTRTEYEAMRQEIVGLKRTLAEFRGSVDNEIDALKRENKFLRRQVSRCTCGCRVHSVEQQQRDINNTTDKMSEADSELAGNNFDKSLDEGDDAELSTGTTRSLVGVLQRENHTLQQRNHELEKQLHMLRAASSRAPPLPTSEGMSFMRELVAYFSLLEASTGSMSTLNDAKDSSYISLLSLDGHHDKATSVAAAVGYSIAAGMNFDGHSFTNGLGSPSPLYSTMPEAFDVEKGLQVQLIPNYNVWVSKSKLQHIVKEAVTQKDGGPLFVLRRLIPLVFTWEELAASRGQGLNCKSTEEVMSKDPLDPTKVLVCKAYMRKFCVENGHEEPLEKSVNETFSHQVNYARRKFKTRMPKSADGTAPTGLLSISGIDSAHDDSFSQSQCLDREQDS